MFGEYILVVNFNNYVRRFAQWHAVSVRFDDRPMPNATAGCSKIINFGMDTASAATVMDWLHAMPCQRCCCSARAVGWSR